jgi:uncharacterized protein YoxC
MAMEKKNGKHAKENGAEPVDETLLTQEILDQLVSGTLAPPNEIIAELVGDLKNLKSDIATSSTRLEAMLKDAEGFRHAVSQLHGAFNKTASDVQKWWKRHKLQEAAKPVASVGENMKFPEGQTPDLPVVASEAPNPN